MTFTFTNYAGIAPQHAPWHDLISQALQGYKESAQAKYLKPGLEEQLKKSKLYNQYYGPNIESEMGLRGAHAGLLGEQTKAARMTNQTLPEVLKNQLEQARFKANNPMLSMTGPAGQIGGLLYLQQHPELAKMQGQQNQNNQNQLSELDQNQSFIPSIEQNQAQAQQGITPQEMLYQSIMKSLQPKAKEYAPSPIRKLQSELHDIEEGYYPGTNRTAKIESQQAKEDLAAPYREKLGSLKQGEHYVYDPDSHEKIGIERPFTPKERATETGRSFFNEVFPQISNGFKGFVGKGSTQNFMKYADEYGKNDEATRKIDDLLLSQKLISAGVVNEASTLDAGKTNMTYRNLLKSFPSSDVPNLIQRYGKELKLPTEAFIKADLRMKDMLNNATEKSTTSVPATKTLYYKPEKYLKTNKEKSAVEEQTEKHYSDADIHNTAIKYGITEEEVKKRLKGVKTK